MGGTETEKKTRQQLKSGDEVSVVKSTVTAFTKKLNRSK